MKIFSKKTNVLILYLLLFLQGFAQKLDYKINSKSTISIRYEVNSESTIILKAAYTNSSVPVDIQVDSKSIGIIKPGKPLENINEICYKSVRLIIGGEEKKIWYKENIVDEWRKLHPSTPKEETKEVTKEETKEKVTVETSATKTEPEAAKNEVPKPQSVGKIPVYEIVFAFKEVLEKDSFYSSMFVQDLKDEVARHFELMSYMKDEESRKDYILKHQLLEYFKDKEATVTSKENGIDSYIGNFIISNYNTNELPNRSDYETRLRNLLEEKISERKDILDDFRSKILDDNQTPLSVTNLFSGKSIAINIAVVFAIACLVGFIVLLIKKTNKKKKAPVVQAEIAKQNAQNDIVVRRKTTSILKKQSLEDVQQNDAYLPIDCADFCSDSAVRRIYLKNTCIKDIYNLYAEDLRNPDNPNEDGCMVLGRWVHDEQNDEYYVSLEEIVKPGDDAIFKEYELNFGGKIKLKVSEKLRKLRRETNLQYDMTCWVHSHPGLGVFFSNADSSVQMQLKHPTHPKFLVAIVIDILTPNQELGIFTFKHDSSINSKADLKRMYSLEELHKWAVESERSSFKPEDHRNIMQKAIKRIDSHYGIELSNGAIIDMCQLQTNQENGLLAWAHGYACEKNGKTEYVLTSVAEEMVIPDKNLLGCYINGAHCSIPTIKRIISNNLKNMKFVLFYSTSEDALTAIPVVNGQLSMDENCYGEEKLEELKIWTRRKR